MFGHAVAYLGGIGPWTRLAYFFVLSVAPLHDMVNYMVN